MDTDIKILTLNLFLRPPGIHTNDSDYKDLRTHVFIDECISAYDIICLQEVFSTMNSRKKQIINQAKNKGFLYHCQSPRPNPFYGHIIDSGLLILSKYPIVENDSVTFSEGKSADRLSAKGAIYAKIQIDDTFLHIFTTHTQASYDTPDYDEYLQYRLLRRGQIKEYKDFIDLKTLNTMYPIVITGDLNIDGLENRKPPKFSVLPK